MRYFETYFWVRTIINWANELLTMFLFPSKSGSFQRTPLANYQQWILTQGWMETSTLKLPRLSLASVVRHRWERRWPISMAPSARGLWRWWTSVMWIWWIKLTDCAVEHLSNMLLPGPQRSIEGSVQSPCMVGISLNATGHAAARKCHLRCSISRFSISHLRGIPDWQAN